MRPSRIRDFIMKNFSTFLTISLLTTATAFSQVAPSAQGGNPIGKIILLAIIIIFILRYFLVVRPKKKKAQELREQAKGNEATEKEKPQNNNIKIGGWILTSLGGVGLIGTMVTKNSANYQLDSIGELFGVGQGYKSTVDTLFYLAIVALIIGIIMLIVGYSKKMVEKIIVCPNCQSQNLENAQFCKNCGTKLRQNIMEQ